MKILKWKEVIMTLLELGKKVTRTKKFTESDVIAFAEVSGENKPIHLEEDFAKKTRFGKRIVH